MQQQDLTQTVISLISRETDLPADAIEESSSLVDLGIDSLDVLKIAIAFEQHFDITITTAELMQIRTVADIVAELEPKVALS